MASPPRVALLLAGEDPPRWALEAVRRLEREGALRVVVVLRSAPAPAPAARPGLLVRAYLSLDRLVFAPPRDPLAPVSLDEGLGDRPTIVLGPPLTEAERAEVLRHRIDVALCLAPSDRWEEVADLAGHGLWALVELPGGAPLGASTGLRSVLAGRPTTVLALRSVGRGAPGRPLARILHRYPAPTVWYSVAATQANLFPKGATVLRRLLADLDARPAPGEEEDPRPERALSGREVAGLLVRFGGRLVGQAALRAICRRQWCLAWASGEAERLAALGPRLSYLEPPRDRFWADPFPARDAAGRTWVLFEEYVHRRRKGHIAAVELGRDGAAGRPVPVLERDHHLSYPFLFEWRGERWMVPETGAAGTVEIHRAAAFPHDWRLEAVLLKDVEAVDATLVEVEGRWWMFASLPTPGTFNFDELHLFHAPSPLGPWTPHRRNPVKTDVRSARPAGRLFFRDGALYRPAQDSSRRYGWALTVQRVRRLDVDGYDEEEADRLEPSFRRGVVAVHTLNALAGLTVIDCCRLRPRLGG